ncbi:MAG TPA: hypothetical protein VGO27_10190 [Candidatus Acidoferrum sp.]|nr:hypothetical protein [Candidatus Acidoferrum sp.]
MKWTLALATSIVLAISLTGSSNFIAAQSSTPEAQRQPHMSSALDHLREAQKSLEAATHDKGGHRSKALKLVKEAITEVEQGIHFDDTHTIGQEKPKSRK